MKKNTISYTKKKKNPQKTNLKKETSKENNKYNNAETKF